MLYSVCERCGDRTQDDAMRAGILIGERPDTGACARFWCPVCRTYWYRVYAAHGRFSWLPDRSSEPSPWLH